MTIRDDFEIIYDKRPLKRITSLKGWSECRELLCEIFEGESIVPLSKLSAEESYRYYYDIS